MGSFFSVWSPNGVGLGSRSMALTVQTVQISTDIGGIVVEKKV
jgi:hypothetical protein